MTCKKAQGFLESNAVKVAEQVDCGKDKKGRDEALALAKTVTTIVAARGKKIETLDLKKTKPDDDTIAGLLLGPTGNLRAPTLRKGKTLYVGFSEEAYQGLLG